MYYPHTWKMRNYWNLKLSNRLLVHRCIFVLLGIAVFPAMAQFSDLPHTITPLTTPYLFPIRPGEPASLAGTMGELRNTHFHSGIDIRTNNEIGWPVRAANDGYISRATITPSGFGLVLYVTHPDGNVTLYGHLNEFKEPVQSYVRQERYRRKVSTIDLYFRKDQFPVTRGDTIAFAGNTGSSAGPHLHFDIRQGKDIALNPLHFRFSEVKDETPPVVRKIAFKTLDVHSRINDQFGRFEFYVTRSGNQYILPQPILASGTIGIEVLAYDIVDHPHYKCGVNYIQVFADSQRVFSQRIENINLTEPRGIYSLMDYRTLKLDGSRFNKLYVEDGNTLPYYTEDESGRITVAGTKNTPVALALRDAYGNTSYARFTFAPSTPARHVQLLDVIKEEPLLTLQENILTIQTRTCSVNTIAYTQGAPSVLEPAYLNSATSVFLLDLRNGIPDSITTCSGTVFPRTKSTVVPGQAFTFYSDFAEISFSDQAVYDTLYFSASYKQEDSLEHFSIGSAFLPLKRSLRVSLQPSFTYPDRARTSVYRVNGRSFAYEGGTWQNNRMNFFLREFGTYTLLTDTVPPTIAPVQVNRYTARFKIRDNLSGIGSYEATLNGQWILMNYDEKTALVAPEPLVKGQPLAGTFILTVTDRSGNKTTYNHIIP
jgi:hypothetical protein